MSALILCEHHKRRAQEMATFAARAENWYCPEDPAYVPGDRDDHVAIFDSYRCVFSYTLRQGVLFRHLSISLVDGAPDKLPGHVAVFTIASWFGFTGGTEGPKGVITNPGSDWQFRVFEEPMLHVALGQRITGAEGSA